MRKFRGIVQTNKEPTDKEILWYKNKELLFFNNGEWQPFINIDSSEIDLSDYITFEEVDEKLKENKLDKTFTYIQGFNKGTSGTVFYYEPISEQTRRISVLGDSGIKIGSGYSYNGTTCMSISVDNDYIKEIIDDNSLVVEGTGENSIKTKNAHGAVDNAIALGVYSSAEGIYSISIGSASASGNASVAIGTTAVAGGNGSIAIGTTPQTRNFGEIAFGSYNVSIRPSGASDNTIDGSKDATLFSVGNGLNHSERHNALEIRQDGSLYIVDTEAEGEFYEKPTVCLQDKLSSLNEQYIDLTEYDEFDIDSLVSQVIKTNIKFDVVPNFVKFKLKSDDLIFTTYASLSKIEVFEKGKLERTCTYNLNIDKGDNTYNVSVIIEQKFVGESTINFYIHKEPKQI